MENHNEYQLLKLKVASEIVRCSQAVVAFSRAFYLEQVLIDRINNEIKETKEKYVHLQDKINNLLKTAHLEDNIVTETNLRVLCSTIQSQLESFNCNEESFTDFQKRTLQAKARRQAKSYILEELSGNELMSKFESLTLSQLRDVNVPEFSCFINESDFGQLEKLNEDWNRTRKDVLSLLKEASLKIKAFKIQDLNSYRNLERTSSPINGAGGGSQHNNSNVPNPNSISTKTNHLPLDEVGKVFANRSGSVLRKFSTLLRRGKRNQKSLSTTESSFDSSTES